MNVITNAVKAIATFMQQTLSSSEPQSFGRLSIRQ